MKYMSGISEIRREEVLDALKDLPEEGALQEALDRLYILFNLQKGIEDADAGRVIPHEDAKKLFRQWLE
jgi:predicted transcriptional regulator